MSSPKNTDNYLCELERLISREDWDNVMKRLKTNPEEAKLETWEDNNSFALHSVCKEQAPLKVVEAVLRAHPAAAQIPEHYCSVLPFHYLTYGEIASIEHLQLVLAAYPAAIAIPDSSGNLPLHAMCMNADDGDLEKVRVVLHANRDAVCVRNREGKTPVHLACESFFEFGRNMDSTNRETLLRELLAENPAAAGISDDDGRLPLHIVCLNFDEGHDDIVLEALIDAYPDSVHAVDNEGHDALYYAWNNSDGEYSRQEKMEVILRAIYNNDSGTSLFVHRSKLVEQNAKIQSLAVGLAGAMGNLRKVEKELAGLKQASGNKRKAEE